MAGISRAKALLQGTDCHRPVRRVWTGRKDVSRLIERQIPSWPSQKGQTGLCRNVTHPAYEKRGLNVPFSMESYSETETGRLLAYLSWHYPYTERSGTRKKSPWSIGSAWSSLTTLSWFTVTHKQIDRQRARKNITSVFEHCWLESRSPKSIY